MTSMSTSGEASVRGLARTVLEYGEEGLARGVVIELARGILAMHENLAIALAARAEGRAGSSSENSRYAFDCDLNQQDTDGSNWALLERNESQPTVVFPGALLWVGRQGAAAEVEILRTELFLTTRGGGRCPCDVSADGDPQPRGGAGCQPT